MILMAFFPVEFGKNRAVDFSPVIPHINGLLGLAFGDR